jgi:hypothetical protein
MIKYALACEQAHAFESWFPSSEAYESQVKRGFVTCPICHSAKIEKQIMAPSIGRRDRGEAAAPPPSLPAAEPRPGSQPMALLSDKEREVRAMFKALREHVMQNAEHVGEKFADEARKMHYGEAEQRSIYGQANRDEARALLEEGIEVMPLPIVPDDRN